MATYVMADIHGDLERFRHMLEKIKFSPADRLYILGDVVDRGPDGAGMLQLIRKTRNMTLILGNHEYMCRRYFAPDATQREKDHWGRNGNAPTLRGLNALPSEELAATLEFLWDLPSHMEITVSGRKFYLVHGFPGESEYRDVWNRPEPDTPNPIPACTLLIGHTPVPCLGRTDEEADVILAELASRGEHLKIYHAPGYIDLDCLCGYEEYPARSLACLRLEDMAEFYA